MKRTLIVCGVLLLLLAQSVLVIAAAASQMSWFNLLSGSGGPASSEHYQVDFTVGQTAGGPASSPGYALNLGYWQNFQIPVYLPVVVRQ
jgi:hypothetical protein